MACNPVGGMYLKEMAITGHHLKPYKTFPVAISLPCYRGFCLSLGDLLLLLGNEAAHTAGLAEGIASTCSILLLTEAVWKCFKAVLFPF